MKMSKLQEAARILKDGSSFLVLGHVNPDGDCVGCMCAVGLALRGLGKSVVLVSADEMPDTYRFLPMTAEVLDEVPSGQQFDAAIVVDCEDLERVGKPADSLSACGAVVEIDHHPGGQWHSTVELVDPEAASCGEIVLELLRECGVRMDRKIAECLLTAIIADTGSFKFANVRPATLRAAADLLEAGASIGAIGRKVYESRSVASMRLLGAALSTLRTAANGRVAYACITRDHLAASEATEAETEGVVNHLRSVRGAQVGILFREGEDGTTRVSLRARDGLDISQIARLFGGGGHKVAAGCTIDRPLSDAIEVVLEAVLKWMES